MDQFTGEVYALMIQSLLSHKLSIHEHFGRASSHPTITADIWEVGFWEDYYHPNQYGVSHCASTGCVDRAVYTVFLLRI
jgi:hypothetical protein